MKHQIINKLDLVAPGYSSKQLDHSMKLAARVRLFKRKLAYGYEMSIFQKRGNGIRTLLEHVGRFTDLSGVYVVSSSTGVPLILGSSKNVLSDVQRLARGSRVKDKQVLEDVANFYGFSNYKMAKELLLAMKVNWVEVTDKTYRLMLKRAMIPLVEFVF